MSPDATLGVGAYVAVGILVGMYYGIERGEAPRIVLTAAFLWPLLFLVTLIRGAREL